MTQNLDTNKARKNLKEQAYDILKDRLINGYYEPGTMLNETALAEDLNFSRTPIREALNLLESEGYINVYPKRGIKIKEITLNDAVQIFQTRLEIEPIALRLAYPNIPLEELIKLRNSFLQEDIDYNNNYKKDMDMHMYFISKCDNKYIIDMMRNVLDKNTQVIVMTSQTKDNVDVSNEQHVHILDCLIDQNLEAAIEGLTTHLIHCRRSAIDYFHIT